MCSIILSCLIGTSLFRWCWEELAHLDRRSTGDGRLAPPCKRICNGCSFQHPKAADVFLSLQVRSVGDENLAIALHPQRLCVPGRGEAANEKSHTGRHHLIV